MDHRINESEITAEHEYIEDASMQLAKRVCAIREELKLTQKDVEARSGIHQADISRIERGIGNPSLDTIVRLARAMNRKLRIELVEDPELNNDLNYSGPLSPYLPTDKHQGDYILRDILNLPNGMRAEIIDGVIYDLASPGFSHQDIAGAVYRMLYDHADSIPDDEGGVVLGDSFVIRESMENACKSYVEPDVGVVFDRSKLIDKKLVVGSPDFICEVASPSDSKHDYIDKRDYYKKIGVKEYWILDPKDKVLTVYKSENGYRSPKVYRNGETVGVGIYNDKLTINLKGLWRFADDI